MRLRQIEVFHAVYMTGSVSGGARPQDGRNYLKDILNADKDRGDDEHENENL